jgi:hypothetical protein
MDEFTEELKKIGWFGSPYSSPERKIEISYKRHRKLVVEIWNPLRDTLAQGLVIGAIEEQSRRLADGGIR